ncbi:HD domain-containing protein [Candidatus Gracilibacteria bacterium]|nr:HD domain-containing protein [Candidatus Gracilibacteria bacterium]
MKDNIKQIEQIQRLVLDIQKIKRNHMIPETELCENVIEHSFSIAMLCWRVYSLVNSKLNLEKIFQYALIHDFLERGLEKDVNAYATKELRDKKSIREQCVFEQLKIEFENFPQMLQTINEYENIENDEVKFVYIIDKIQAIILGKIDNWRPYINAKISYEQFSKKIDSYTTKCPDELQEIYKSIIIHGKETFYDQP